MEHARASGAGGPPESEEGRRFKLLSAAEKPAHVRRNDAPSGTRALKPKWYVRVGARVLPPVAIALVAALCAAGVAALILPVVQPNVPELHARSLASGAERRVVLRRYSVVYTLFVVACLRLLPVGLRLMRHLYSQMLLVTPEGCVVGDPRTGAVER